MLRPHLTLVAVRPPAPLAPTALPRAQNPQPPPVIRDVWVKSDRYSGHCTVKTLGGAGV